MVKLAFQVVVTPRLPHPFIYLSFEGNFALWRSSGGDERLPAALFDAVDECLRRDVNDSLLDAFN